MISLGGISVRCADVTLGHDTSADLCRRAAHDPQGTWPTRTRLPSRFHQVLLIAPGCFGHPHWATGTCSSVGVPRSNRGVGTCSALSPPSIKVEVPARRQEKPPLGASGRRPCQPSSRISARQASDLSRCGLDSILLRVLSGGTVPPCLVKRAPISRHPPKAPTLPVRPMPALLRSRYTEQQGVG